MHLLITRPNDDSQTMQASLEKIGVESTIAPVLTITFEALSDCDLAGVQSIIVTSQNSVKSLQHNHLVAKLNALPLYAVGPATARIAERVGFNNVKQGPGSAKALADVLTKDCDPTNGALIHFAGAHLAFDLKGVMEAQGYKIREVLTYRAVLAKQFPPPATAALNAGKVNGVILMSARSARAFTDLMRHHNLTSTAGQMHYFCLSPSVKDALLNTLAEPPAHPVLIPTQPNTEELLALIARFAAN
ncbi:MAG: uroporphyrinogen-III synthase [Alphaproteobacteria bacterium]|nr:uroporphyrinogen-III synthase [Alphaproteobacteria bacterium]